MPRYVFYVSTASQFISKLTQSSVKLTNSFYWITAMTHVGMNNPKVWTQ